MKKQKIDFFDDKLINVARGLKIHKNKKVKLLIKGKF